MVGFTVRDPLLSELAAPEVKDKLENLDNGAGANAGILRSHR